jgi:hypothetical protein
MCCLPEARLIPVDAVGANDVVERPALLAETPGGGGALGVGERSAADGDDSPGPCQRGTEETTTVHGVPPACLQRAPLQGACCVDRYPVDVASTLQPGTADRQIHPNELQAIRLMGLFMASLPARN